MYKYIEPFITCDLILNMYKGAPRIEESEIHRRLPDEESKRHLREAIDQLELDQYIKHDSNSHHWYLIRGAGTQQREHGGYKAEFERKLLGEEVKSQVEDLNVQMANSQLDTNSAVRSGVIISRNIGILTLFVATISMIAVIASVYVANQGVTSEDIKLLYKQLQMNQQSLEYMRQAQIGIDSSLQKAVKNSFYRK